MDAEEVFRQHLPVIGQIAESICRRNRVGQHDAEDFASDMRLRLCEDDFAVIRKFQGKSSFSTYLDGGDEQSASWTTAGNIWGEVDSVVFQARSGLAPSPSCVRDARVSRWLRSFDAAFVGNPGTEARGRGGPARSCKRFSPSFHVARPRRFGRVTTGLENCCRRETVQMLACYPTSATSSASPPSTHCDKPSARVVR